MTKSRITIAFLALLTAIAVYLCYLLVAPFLKPIVFSAILAVICYPAHVRIHRRIRNRNIAAAFSTILVSLLVTSISVFLGRTIVSGLRDVYQSLAGSGDSKERLSLYIVHLFDRALDLVSRYIPISVPDLKSAVLNQAEKAVSGVLTISAGVLGGITSLAANALIAFFVLFFFLRDGRSTLRRVGAILPLRPGQLTRLFSSIRETLNAIVYGTAAMAALQGTLTGVAFSFLGISSPVLWGVVTSLCALLPVIGTAFVLLPATCMLIFSGHWIKGLILLIWALVVVHPVDNVLRPYLIGERVKLPTIYLFFALLGGLKTFGALGLFTGPLILAVTIALLRFLREETRAGNWKFQENSQDHAPSEPLSILK
jgi:predicted PurR-regulated permease PerM